MTKRIMDIAVSAIGLVLLCPVLVVIALLIKWTSPGPVLYLAERVGQGGKVFTLYKFRSMVVDAHKLGPAVTGAQDKRITPIGRWLRRTKVDELPQMLNVLKGDMSLVGPRPEDPRYVRLYTSEQRRVLEVRPGITSAASVAYRHEETLLSAVDWEAYYIQTVMPAKLELDLAYIRHHNLIQDVKILWQTLLALFR
jgi:lipopolysaccharide/colanic/teichoic acid biosynthesis glycosyltransferase